MAAMSSKREDDAVATDDGIPIAISTTEAIEVQVESRWVHDKESSVLQVEVPGFKKGELTVRPDADGNCLMIIGEGRDDSGQITQIDQRFDVPDLCTCNGMKTVFDNGVLSVTLPHKEPSIDATRNSPNQLRSVDGGTDQAGAPISWVGIGVAAIVAIAVGFLAYRRPKPLSRMTKNERN